MKRLLSLPPNLVKYFSEIERVNPDEWFCTSDPINSKLGSGGGTTFLLEECFEHERSGITIDEWLGKEKRILLHAGGQSRRLPGYAPSGKILTPIPVFRWAKGQRLDQNLLQLQLPLYNKIMKKAPVSFIRLLQVVMCIYALINPYRTFHRQMWFVMDYGLTLCLQRTMVYLYRQEKNQMSWSI